MDQPGEQEEDGRSSVSLPIIAVALAVALIAGAIVAWVLVNRDDDEPETPSAALAELDLAAPLFRSGDTSSLLHLVVDPVREGENQFQVRFSEAATAFEPVSMPMDAVELSIEPLTGDEPAQTQSMTLQDDGTYLADDAVELQNGWWEVTVTTHPPGEEPRSTIFYLMPPDPNVNGFDAVPGNDSDQAAEEVFQAGLDRWSTTQSMKYIERLTTGQGAVSVSQREVTDGADGNPAATRMITSQFELLTIEDQTWQRTPGSHWVERTEIAIYPPSAWLELYEGGTDFVLGKSITHNDRDTQIVMFYVPATDALVAAWYAWWVDTETSYVVREAMISSLHYMIYEFGDFNSPMIFEPPIGTASPVASPVASPSTSPTAN